MIIMYRIKVPLPMQYGFIIFLFVPIDPSLK